MNLRGLSFEAGWTLFLDRDGVINERIDGGYVTVFEDFIFLEGVKEALRIFSGIFGNIIVVSNQQGIGKGLMKTGDADEIHRRMIAEVAGAGGRIDRVYYSPYLESEQHPDRKPGTGMALSAVRDYPGISLARSVMVGDSASDMEFGRRAGMITVLITDGRDNQDPAGMADYIFPNLLSFAKACKTD